MNLNDFFRVKKQPRRDPASGFWEQVRLLCQSHVEKMLAHFQAMGWPRLDWAEPRYQALIKPEALDRLITEARHLLTEGAGKGILMPGPFFRADSWVVTFSVFPSAEDNAFLDVCPEGSYDELALQTRSFFRSHVDSWESSDFAHWFLLIDESKSDASIHLHTIWSLEQCLRWISVPTNGQPGTLIPAPSIVPIEIIRTNSADLMERILRDDATYSAKQESHENEVLAGRIAKVLLMDSITAEGPAEVPPAGARGPFWNALEQACRAHAEDCQKLGVDIPLVLGMPVGHINHCEQNLIQCSFFGLKEEQIFWLEEIVTWLFAAGEGQTSAQKEKGCFLAGGGSTILVSIGTPLWSRLWSQGIRWVLFGQMWNTGCRIDAKWLNAMAACQKDGFLECASREHLPDSKLILLNSGSEPKKLVCVDEHRLRTDELVKLSASATMVGTGSFWLKLEAFVSHLGLDPELLLERFERDFAPQALQNMRRQEQILLFHSRGGLLLYLPLWEIFSSLDLQAFRVPDQRYSQIVETEP